MEGAAPAERPKRRAKSPAGLDLYFTITSASRLGADESSDDEVDAPQPAGNASRQLPPRRQLLPVAAL